jgi:hypothetical protein
MSTIIRPDTSERVPFDMLIGHWIGVGVVFLPNGSYYSHITSRVTVTETEQQGVRRIRYVNDSGGQVQVPVEGEALPEEGDRYNVFHPLFFGVVDALCRCRYEILFEAHGKRVVAVEKSPSIVSANGYMSTNDNYAFIVRDTFTKDGQTSILTLHNNHYFSASNTRHVIGTISDPDGETILLTSFTYTSYTPPLQGQR